MRSDRTDLCDWLELADGRRLAYTVAGPSEGVPILYCHGAIGTPLRATVDLERLTADLGLRFIAPSRPGVGGSHRAPRRTLAGFADDVEALADALRLESFSIVGVSAGGPYALAVAGRLGDRVQRVGLCSSLAPIGAPHRAAGVPLRIRLALAGLRWAPDLCRVAGNAALPLVARHPAVARTSFLDAARDGVDGMIEDYLTYSADWGFSPAAVEQEVHLWHGLRDLLVPVEHALQLAVMLPRCRVFLDPDEGHHFFRSSLQRILAVLVGQASEPEQDVEITRGRAGVWRRRR